MSGARQPAEHDGGWLDVAAMVLTVAIVGGAPVVLVLASAGAAGSAAFKAALVALLAGLLGMLGVAPRLGRIRRSALVAAMDAAFQRVREDGEAQEVASYVEVALRPWLLDVAMRGYLYRTFQARGWLVVTNRRLLLLRADTGRLDRAEDLTSVQVRQFTRDLLRPRLFLSVDGRPDLWVTFPRAWAASAATMAAAIERGQVASTDR